MWTPRIIKQADAMKRRQVEAKLSAMDFKRRINRLKSRTPEADRPAAIRKFWEDVAALKAEAKPPLPEELNLQPTRQPRRRKERQKKQTEPLKRPSRPDDERQQELFNP